MINPDEAMIRHVLTALKTITTQNGYALTVQLVEFKSRMVRDLNADDLPAVLIGDGPDDFERENFGGGRAQNAQYRIRDLLLYVSAAPREDELVPGSWVKWAVVKCLHLNRDSNDQARMLPEDITVGVTNSLEFERLETGVVRFVIPIRLKYAYVAADL